MSSKILKKLYMFPQLTNLLMFHLHLRRELMKTGDLRCNSKIKITETI